MTHVELLIGLYSSRGFEVASWSNRCSNVVELPLQPGENTFRIAFLHLCLLPGHYYFDFALASRRGIDDYVSEAVQFEIVHSPNLQRLTQIRWVARLCPSQHFQLYTRSVPERILARVDRFSGMGFQTRFFCNSYVARFGGSTMLTTMTEADRKIALKVFGASRSSRGDKSRDDRKFLVALHYFVVHNITRRAPPDQFGHLEQV